MSKHPAAVALGRLGGKANTPAQARARAANGRLGGRPKTRCPHGKQPSRCRVCRTACVGIGEPGDIGTMGHLKGGL